MIAVNNNSKLNHRLQLHYHQDLIEYDVLQRLIVYMTQMAPAEANLQIRARGALIEACKGVP